MSLLVRVSVFIYARVELFLLQFSFARFITSCTDCIGCFSLVLLNVVQRLWHKVTKYINKMSVRQTRPGGEKKLQLSNRVMSLKQNEA